MFDETICVDVDVKLIAGLLIPFNINVQSTLLEFYFKDLNTTILGRKLVPE